MKTAIIALIITLSQIISYTKMFSTTIRHIARRSNIARRCYVATPQSFQVFDRDVKRLQKDRAAANVEESRTVDYLKDEIAARVADRLLVP